VKGGRAHLFICCSVVLQEMSRYPVQTEKLALAWDTTGHFL
jgi:hypothetical protein